MLGCEHDFERMFRQESYSPTIEVRQILLIIIPVHLSSSMPSLSVPPQHEIPFKVDREEIFLILFYYSIKEKFMVNLRQVKNIWLMKCTVSHRMSRLFNGNVSFTLRSSIDIKGFVHKHCFNDSPMTGYIFMGIWDWKSIIILTDYCFAFCPVNFECPPRDHNALREHHDDDLHHQNHEQAQMY